MTVWATLGWPGSTPTETGEVMGLGTGLVGEDGRPGRLGVWVPWANVAASHVDARGLSWALPSQPIWG